MISSPLPGKITISSKLAFLSPTKNWSIKQIWILTNKNGNWNTREFSNHLLLLGNLNLELAGLLSESIHGEIPRRLALSESEAKKFNKKNANTGGNYKFKSRWFVVRQRSTTTSLPTQLALDWTFALAELWSVAPNSMIIPRPCIVAVWFLSTLYNRTGNSKIKFQIYLLLNNLYPKTFGCANE